MLKEFREFIARGNVIDLALCTYRDEALFFSFRRATHRHEPEYGRLISAIAISR